MAAAGRSLINPHGHWNSFLKAQNFPNGRGESQAPHRTPLGRGCCEILFACGDAPAQCLSGSMDFLPGLSPEVCTLPTLIKRTDEHLFASLSSQAWPQAPWSHFPSAMGPSPSLAHASREGQGRLPRE